MRQFVSSSGEMLLGISENMNDHTWEVCVQLGCHKFYTDYKLDEREYAEGICENIMREFGAVEVKSED